MYLSNSFRCKDQAAEAWSFPLDSKCTVLVGKVLFVDDLDRIVYSVHIGDRHLIPSIGDRHLVGELPGGMRRVTFGRGAGSVPGGPQSSEEPPSYIQAVFSERLPPFPIYHHARHAGHHLSTKCPRTRRAFKTFRATYKLSRGLAM